MPEHTQAPPPPIPNPAIKISRPAATGETVYVACKLPAGIVLRVFTWEEYQEPRRDGTYQTMKRAVPVAGMDFVVRGTWVSTAGQAYNQNNGAIAQLLPGGYAISEGCPKDVWDSWFEQNKKSKLVQNNVVFAHKDRETLLKEVRQHSSILCGLEPLDRANPGARMGGIDRRLRLDIFEAGADGPRR